MKTTATYDHYFDYGEMTAFLRQLAEDHKPYVKLSSLLTTVEEREVWLLEITDTATGAHGKKPAYCAIGPVHCREVIGVMTVLHFADYLLTNKDLPQVATLLKNYTICLIPMPVPDGTDYTLHTNNIPRSLPRKVNRDLNPGGLMRKDMDGDGIARSMRFRDPLGPWKISEADSRVMLRRRPDELEGDFYIVLDEGEFECEDWRDFLFSGPERFPYNLNRNWPYGWQAAAAQRGAGDYPLQAEENRAIADFIANCTNLNFILSFHASGGVFFYPPATKPPASLSKNDLRILKAFVNIGTEETGFPSRNMHDAFALQNIPIAGSYDDYVLFGRGLFCHAIECWDLDARVGVPPKWDRPLFNEDAQFVHDNEIKLLNWLDQNCGPEAFKPWTKYQHPQLGEVEIGGYDQVFLNNPPPALLLEEVEKITRFMARQVKLLPHLQIMDREVEALQNGLFRVSATIYNAGYIPTYVSDEAKKLGLAQPVRVGLEGDAQFVNCKSVQTIGDLEGTSSIWGDIVDTKYILPAHKPCRKRVSWLVEGAKGNELTIRVASERGGERQATVVLG